MTVLMNAVAGVLLLLLVVGLLRIWLGPEPADRMLASQLFASTGVALLLVLAESQAQPALRDVALVLALLAVLATVAFVTRVMQVARADSKGEQRDV
ncbi:MAG TPA: pH regulation protein F [Halieaceae bacterium]|jgi:multicomponent Na+:H+ antiporter subunit F|uniref:monovalent cation/H+ antiporter complex subunit F n=1 Tax=Haliea TaxID=475794 RepID=UPI000C463228|nr:monovalent cation/H+ antiporter complex subunit F [Haliea sp.]HBQ40635.1 pH regulation protein F [Halieaceae bacterium]MAD62867.1 pH regulation protein F [Haliea sp.]MAY94409.1 pH regulation protein F [Haliea sp.]MBP69750.1 pH regulation protein F [Haliea sp.]HCD55435.1 pH regulation protein F [Halieaceae bacterium]|tara:strand:+ start:231 stop:521 length:291 start_codon:yes stop_codon:yes gene_type:complete